MQSKFRECDINSKIVWRKLGRDAHPAPRQVFCTRSQTIECFDKDWKFIALMHQYKRTDGTIAASGEPDPKRLFVEEEDTLYYV